MEHLKVPSRLVRTSRLLFREYSTSSTSLVLVDFPNPRRYSFRSINRPSSISGLLFDGSFRTPHPALRKPCFVPKLLPPKSASSEHDKKRKLTTRGGSTVHMQRSFIRSWSRKQYRKAG